MSKAVLTANVSREVQVQMAQANRHYLPEALIETHSHFNYRYAKVMFMKILLAVLAGFIGGLVNSIGLWEFGALGINQALGFDMVPVLTIKWLLPRLISSGAWGLLFLLPFWPNTLINKGMVLSIGPLLLMLFMVFPKTGAGMLGLKLGSTAPLFAIFFTLVWGISAGMFLKLTKK